MERTLPRDDYAPAGVKSWQLWFSLVAGTIVWMLHLMIVYPLTSLTCEWGWFPFMVGALSGLQVIQLVVTVIAAVITIVAGYFAFQSRRRLGNGGMPDTSRHRFMAWLGLALNIMFTALIVISVIPILTLPPCG